MVHLYTHLLRHTERRPNVQRIKKKTARTKTDEDVVVVAVNDNQDEGNAEEPPQRQPDARQREMKQIVKIQGDFEMPMSILEIGRFERLNNVQINVFR